MDPDTQAVHRRGGRPSTLPRQAVLGILQAAGSDHRHLTADDIYLRLQQQGHPIGLATVYRALSDLETVGAVRRYQFMGGKASFERADTGPHFHMVDQRCGKVTEFADAELLERLQQLVTRHGLRIADVQLHVYVESDRTSSA